ncbi:helix-turn-helix domain-containing protein [Lentzea nigeriaca]|uniref:helix-turn-helix domain-containing protein n=1 Tax=Lentzea nigeriaca TaxID=1128665 RepID=UPI00195A54C7|nr:helix-turn-helix domain-containing protein [Lentzea nigeriaca]MBM7858336.1 transposase [Lentzea nigeriaca]
MYPQDARKVSPDVLEALRRRAVAAVDSGLSRAEVARMLGVSRQTISVWHREYRTRGEEALRSRRRGRQRGEQLALSYAQQLWTIRTVTTCGPDEVGLSYWLWTNQALAELVNNRFRIALSATTVRNYLIRWGVLPESVLANRPGGGEADPGHAVPVSGETLWMHSAPFHWLTGPQLHSDGASACSATDGHGNAMLYAVSARGTVLFLCTHDPFDGARLTEFFSRLLRQRGRRLNIVQGWRPTRRADVLTAWMEQRAGEVSVRFAVEDMSFPAPRSGDTR